uniref:hypothetical protein n=1 Tax=Polynucleobacter sp. TaxID=2029855 RepID=UPI004048D7F7
KHLGNPKPWQYPEQELTYKHPYILTLTDKLKKVKYMIIGFEIGEQGTEHIQGYLDFENPRALSGLTRLFKFIHWEPRRGTWDEAVNYCKKDNTYFEYGEPNKQGDRSDLVKIKDEIMKGAKVDDIAVENPNLYHQYGRTLNKIEDLAMRKKFRTEMTRGTWYWGPTGVGKSHVAFDGYTPETHYVYPNDGGWWDGYCQQETVIFNDFRGEIPYNELLNILDKWPYNVRRRCREPMPFISKRVIITSSLPPEEVYCKRNERDSIAQLLRRIDVVEMNSQAVNLEDEVLEPEQKWSEGNTRPPTFSFLTDPTTW